MELLPVFKVVLCLVVSTSILTSEAAPTSTQEAEECNSAACQEAAQALLDSMDTSADPCKDFYRYACGGWIDKHRIPEEKSRYSQFDVMTDQVVDEVAEILKSALSENHAKPVLNSAAFFQACIDEEAREAQGLEPLKNLLNSFGGWPMANPEWSDNGYQWQKHVATIRRMLGISIAISIVVDADANHTSQHIIYLDDPRFGIGRNQLVHLTASERNGEIIGAYRKFMIDTGKLLYPNANETQLGIDADQMIQFESALAKFTKPPEETRDADTWYHKMTIAQLQKVTENTYFQWSDFLNEVFSEFPGITDETEVILADEDYIKNAIKLAHDTDPRILANYIGWIVIMGIGHHTTKKFRHNDLLFNQVTGGVEEVEKLEWICTLETIAQMGHAVGRIYVDNYFKEEGKHDVEKLEENIRSAYKSTLRENTWMDEDTKNKAIEKLEAMVSRMAYPEWIKDDKKLSEYYSSVPHIRKNEFFASLVEVTKAIKAIRLKKWNQPTNRENEWVTDSSVLDTHYDFNSNIITISSGVLNLPFYKYGRSAALNFGGIGTVIGHEVSHGFDDQGSDFDKEGNLIDWWSKETKEKFDQKANCFRNQYSSYVDSTTNMKLNGNNTVGENIADNGALRNAFIAYKIHLLHGGEDDVANYKRLPGVPATPEQLFFLGYASMWCGRERKESLEWNIQYDTHAPNEFRAIVPMANSEAFAEAFNCPLGSPMNPETKCVLW